MASYLTVRNLTKSYGRDSPAITDLSLEVAEGELITLLGPSGCGKTTTIRIIAGIVSPSRGSIVLDGREITNVPSAKRDIGVVFQGYALFPHMSVAKNIGYGLRMRRWRSDRRDARIGELLELTGLADVRDSLPGELSGGMQQRVGLARALAFQPRLLLMDEPFSALDARLRLSMREEVKRVQRESGVTTICVTHDQEEALTMSDRVAVMSKGRVAQVASPEEVYERPANSFVAEFVGLNSRFVGKATGASTVQVGQSLIHVADCLTVGAHYVLSVRPEHVVVHINSTTSGECMNSFAGEVAVVDYAGGWETLSVWSPDLGAKLLAAVRPGEWKIGQTVRVTLDPSNIRAFPS